jgi:hypothetical protein
MKHIILAIVAIVATLTGTVQTASAQILATANAPRETGTCATCKQHVSLHTKRPDGTLACPTTAAAPAVAMATSGAVVVTENCTCGLPASGHISFKGRLHCPSEPLQSVTPGYTWKDLMLTKRADGTEIMRLPPGCIPLNPGAANAAANTVVVTTTAVASPSPPPPPQVPTPAKPRGLGRGTTPTHPSN